MARQAKHPNVNRAMLPEPADPLAESEQTLAGTLLKSQRACLEGMTSWNGEVLDFVRQRLETDADTSASLAQCGSWMQVAAIQQEWAWRAAQDYLGEATKLYRLAAKTAVDGFPPLRAMATAARTFGGERAVAAAD